MMEKEVKISSIRTINIYKLETIKNSGVISLGASIQSSIDEEVKQKRNEQSHKTA